MGPLMSANNGAGIPVCVDEVEVGSAKAWCPRLRSRARRSPPHSSKDQEPGVLPHAVVIKRTPHWTATTNGCGQKGGVWAGHRPSGWWWRQDRRRPGVPGWDQEPQARRSSSHNKRNTAEDSDGSGGQQGVDLDRPSATVGREPQDVHRPTIRSWPGLWLAMRLGCRCGRAHGRAGRAWGWLSGWLLG